MCAGFAARLAAEVAALRPPGQRMLVHISRQPLLDTWRGAAALGMTIDLWSPEGGALTRQLYEEAGVDYLREFRGFRCPTLT